MSEAMTYDSLVTDVMTYAERDDQPFVDQIPRLIMLAENKMATKVRGLGFLRYVTGTLAVGEDVIEKPARWRETASFTLVGADGKVNYLKNRSYEYCQLYSTGLSAPEEPTFYADYGYNHFFVSGAPIRTTNFQLSYFERPEPLSSVNQTNWTTQYAPQLILFGTLAQAQIWLKLSDKAAEFKALYDEAVLEVSAEADRRVTDMNSGRKAT